MNILLNGYCGFMGREVVKLCREGYRGARLVCGVDISAEGNYEDKVYSSPALVNDEDIDCIIDFSHHSAVRELLDFATEKKLPIVVATTGHTAEELDAINEAALEIPVFHSGNMSLGIALLIDLAAKTAKAMPEAEIEIVETHHNRKIDAPSGTALMIANAIKDTKEEASVICGRSGHGKRAPGDIGIHSVRMGNVVGIHEVMIGTPNQTITLKHEAHNRALFAEGAIAAAEFLIEMPKGKYDMNDLVTKANAEAATV